MRTVMNIVPAVSRLAGAASVENGTSPPRDGHDFVCWDRSARDWQGWFWTRRTAPDACVECGAARDGDDPVRRERCFRQLALEGLAEALGDHVAE
jgi:hypothetical protein